MCRAQEQLGDVVFVETPDVGRTVEAGESVGAVESVKVSRGIDRFLIGSKFREPPSP